MVKLRSIIIGALILISLVAAFIIVKFINNDKDASSENNTKAESVKLFNHGESDCKTIILKNESNEYIINNVNGTWEIEGMKNADKNLVAGVVSDILNVSAHNTITENVDDLEAFGLNDPKATVTIELNDGNKEIFFLGSLTPVPNTYYFKKDKDNNIYAVYSGVKNSIDTKFEDKMDLSIDMVAKDKITMISLKQKDEKEILLNGLTDGNDSKTTTGISMEEPYKNMSLDEAKVNNFISNITSFSLHELAEENAVDLTKYGLLNPVLDILAMDRDGKAVKISAGGQDETGQYYIRINDGKSVYKAYKQSVDELHIRPYDLVNKVIYSPKLEDVNEINIEHGADKYIFKITKEDSKYEYSLNDLKLDEERGNDIFTSIASIITDGEYKEDISSNVAMKITYSLKGEKNQAVIEFKEYDDNFYRVYVDGVSYFISSKDYVKSLISKLK